MARKNQRERLRVATAFCVVLGLIEAAVLMALGGYFSGGLLELLGAAVLWVVFGVMLGFVQWFLPYAFIFLGLSKLFEQKKEALEALGDDNVVYSDPDGERKLHDYLTAITSTEARIGLLQRSAPYIPAEQRPPEGTPVVRYRLSKPSKLVRWVSTFGGLVLAFYFWPEVSGGVSALTNVQHFFAAVFVGGVAGYTYGFLYSLIFGRVVEETPRTTHDAGRSNSEAA